jgi:hypothetical protein
VITLHGRDAHLGHDLDHAFDGGLREVLAGELVLEVRQHLVADHAVEGFEGEIGVDDRAAESDEQREVMHFARVSGFERQRHLHAQTRADQEMVQARHGQQRGDGREFPVHAAIAEDENVDLVLFDHAHGFRAHLFDGLDEPVFTAISAEQDAQRADLEAGQRQAPHLGELFVGEHRPRELEPPAIARARIEQVAFRA